MSNSARSSPPPAPNGGEISSSDAAQLLSMGLNDPRRPVDDLIERLAAADGHAWLTRVVGRHAALVQSIDRAAARRPSLESLVALKEQEKEHLAEAATVDEALAALAAYCVCVASALALHGVLISSQARDDWDTLLVDLAEVMPAPWREVLIEAASRENAKGPG